MKITDLRVNRVRRPIGFEISDPSFSWIIEKEDDRPFEEIKSMRLVVEKEDETIYDSGISDSLDSLGQTIPLDLTPRSRYQWSVAAKDMTDRVVTAASFFETGKMNEEWTGRWITPDTENAGSTVVRKKFRTKQVKNGRIYMCGLGLYELYLNGQRVSDEYLAPGYHSYDFHVQVQTYDISPYLNSGENELTVFLADGWFRGRLGFDGGQKDIYGNRCAMIAEVYIDGMLVSSTDATYEWHSSPVVSASIYDGETFDARLLNGIVDANDEENWHPVRLEDPERIGANSKEWGGCADKAYKVLTDRYSLPVKIMEERKATILATPAGETILDFGQNLTGWVEFDSALLEGEGIRLTAAEILQDGNFYRENLRTAKAEFIYYSDGNARHVRPHFTFYGFRYMKVEYLQEDGQWGNPVLERLFPQLLENGSSNAVQKVSGFTACHLRSDFDEIGHIETGIGNVNQLLQNIMWGQKDNFLDVPTDCPQRDERLGWTGDAQIFSDTACYNMDTAAFYRKYLWDMRAEQSIIDGAGPNVVPRLKEGMISEFGSCPWGDAAVVIPWNTYLHFGNKRMLLEAYPGMKAYVEYERNREEKIDGPHLIKDGFHFADWLSLDNPEPGPFGATDPLYIASAYYYRNCRILSKCAEELASIKSSLAEDSAFYKDLAEQILVAIWDKYFDSDGLCTSHTQTGSAIAIMFELNPGNAVQKEGEALAKRVHAKTDHLDTGFVGTSLLCPALTKTGHEELAMTLFLKEDYPGWLYSVALGATTIWERWNSVDPDGHINKEGMNSLNHYSYGSIASWLYGYVCGIRPLAPGFARAAINPHPDIRLHHSDCTLRTPMGTYQSRWEYQEDGTVSYQIVVPPLGEAEFTCGAITRRLSSGTYSFRS